jgi:hypothetical protein
VAPGTSAVMPIEVRWPEDIEAIEGSKILALVLVAHPQHERIFVGRRLMQL